MDRKLYMLQTRNGKRTAKVGCLLFIAVTVLETEDHLKPKSNTCTRANDDQASVQIAVDMVKEGLITEQEALLRIDAEVRSSSTRLGWT